MKRKVFIYEVTTTMRQIIAAYKPMDIRRMLFNNLGWPEHVRYQFPNITRLGQCTKYIPAKDLPYTIMESNK